MSIISEFQERRDEGNKRVFAEDFLPFNRFFALDSRAYESGAIPEKYKELMGLAASMVLRCNDCIAYHIIQAHEKGSSKAELNETFNIALVVGGSIVIPHLRYALSIVDEIYSKDE